MQLRVNDNHPTYSILPVELMLLPGHDPTCWASDTQNEAKAPGDHSLYLNKVPATMYIELLIRPDSTCFLLYLFLSADIFLTGVDLAMLWLRQNCRPVQIH